MAKRSITDSASEGISTFARIARGNVADVRDAQDVRDTKDTKDAKATSNTNKAGEELARLNLRIPISLKEYLTIAAAKESIAQRRPVSPTTYICNLIRQDMAKHND